MNTQKIKAFTLVELIVVITILAILGTIAFISLQGYSAQARDSVRTSDIKALETSLELFITVAGKYPLPSNFNNITYSGGIAWSQGTVGDSIITNIKNISKKPLDPLYGNEYTYSVTETKREYQIGYILEDGNSVGINKAFNSVYAANNGVGIIKGNYNGKLLNINTSSGTLLLAIPSIISSISGSLDLQNILDNNGLVYSDYANTPLSYKKYANNRTYTGGFLYTPSNLIVYSGSLNKDLSINDVVKINDNLIKSYDGTVLKSIFSDNAYSESFVGITKLLTSKFGVKSFNGKLPKTCREMFFVSNYYSFSSKNSTFDVDGNGSKEPFSAYCLLDSNNEVFTLSQMDSTEALHASEMEQLCNDKGLQLYVPRTKEHFESSLDKYGYEYFRLMGIYPNVKGLGCQNSQFRYLGYSSSVDYDYCLNWLPNDGGRYYVNNDFNLTQPSGDNDINGSMVYHYNTSTNRISSYNDVPNSYNSGIIGGNNINTSIGGYKNNKWICSGKDESTEMYKPDLLQILAENINILATTTRTSCRDIKRNGESLGDGYYIIKPSNDPLVAYCDMTSNGEAWTLNKVNLSESLHASEMEQYCSNLGLQLFVPRTKEHFEAALNVNPYSFFRVMGIYPTIKGNVCQTKNMFFGGNLLTATTQMCTSWLPNDGGRYFIEDYISNSEPNGDNDIDGSMRYNYNISTNKISSYNDIVNSNNGGILGGINNNTSIGGYKNNRFICSGKDEKDIY